MRTSLVATSISVASVLTMVAGAQSAPATPTGGHNASFANGVPTTGWIDFNFQDGRKILVPAKVNGQDVLVQLIDGTETSYIDKDFAASIGVSSDPSAGAKGTVNVQVQLGDLTLRYQGVAGQYGGETLESRLPAIHAVR
jgi:hypothetical protein